jgi:hypothetical protein
MNGPCPKRALSRPSSTPKICFGQRRAGALGVDAVALLAWLRPRYRATEIAGGLTLTRWVTISQADGE